MRAQTRDISVIATNFISKSKIAIYRLIFITNASPALLGQQIDFITLSKHDNKISYITPGGFRCIHPNCKLEFYKNMQGECTYNSSREFQNFTKQVDNLQKRCEIMLADYCKKLSF